MSRGVGVGFTKAYARPSVSLCMLPVVQDVMLLQHRACLPATKLTATIIIE